MHYVHVKHKEKTVKTYTLEQLHDDPALYGRLVAQAHRERSRAIHAGFVWLVDYAKAQLARHRGMRPARWVARLG